MTLKLLMICLVVALHLNACGTQQEKNFLPWEKLNNPVYHHDGWATKDVAMYYEEDEETFYIFFGAFYFDNGQERSHVVEVSTKDFMTYSEPIINWSGQEQGWLGMASPNITLIDDTYYLTYNSWGDLEGKNNTLFYATSKDLKHWEKDKPLAQNIVSGTRAIDAAIMARGDKIYLVYKDHQTPKIAVADSINSDHWQIIGSPNSGWFENGQFIEIDDKVHLLTTGRPNNEEVPVIVLMQMNGNGDDLKDWLQWSVKKIIDFPREDFNTHKVATGAFIADWRKYNGHFYCLYSGKTESKSHLGRGNHKIALSRSLDLLNWAVPPTPQLNH